MENSGDSFYSDNYSFENQSCFGDSVEGSILSIGDAKEESADEDNENSEIDDVMFEIQEEETNETQKKNEELNAMKKLAPAPNKERISSPYLTKYEKALVLGKRASMIEKNSPIYIIYDVNENLGPLGIAQRQLQKNVIPFVLRRFLPNGEYEDWKLTELIK